MTANPFTYRREKPGDAAWIEALQAELFGPERFKRAAYVLREGVPPDPALSFVATADGHPVASVRMTAIRLGGRPALLLGPLIVAPAYRGRGAGRALVRKALEAAREAGHRLVMLVGDLPYYGPLGFTFLGRDVIQLPGAGRPGPRVGRRPRRRCARRSRREGRERPQTRPSGPRSTPLADPGRERQADKGEQPEQAGDAEDADEAVEQRHAVDALQHARLGHADADPVRRRPW